MSKSENKLRIKQSFRATPVRPDLLSISIGIVSALIAFILWLKTPNSNYAWNILIYLEFGLFAGFILGWVYTWWIKWESEKIKISIDSPGDDAFEIDLDNPVNVIQDGKGNNPYTIVFVANPWMLKHEFNDDGSVRRSERKKDPIINDKSGALFYRIVVRSIQSFLENELLSLPEIFPKIRFVTIFGAHGDGRLDLVNKQDANALCENIPGAVEALSPIGPYTLEGEYNNVVKNYVDKALNGEEWYKDKLCDIIFVVSADEEQYGAAAFFTRELENGAGERYQFNFQNSTVHTTRTHVRKPEQNGSGLVAISAWDDRLKTVVHEFAHAMSSEKNGAIIDEYVDEYHAETEADIGKYMINRKIRINADNRVPDIFGCYGVGNPIVLNTYNSDRFRNDKESDWKSYVAERPDINSSCIMDYSYTDYRFDKLIFDFMYDRLLTKINRP